MIKVLQLGNDDWSKRYKIPTDYHWHFNDFQKKSLRQKKPRLRQKEETKRL